MIIFIFGLIYILVSKKFKKIKLIPQTNSLDYAAKATQELQQLLAQINNYPSERILTLSAAILRKYLSAVKATGAQSMTRQELNQLGIKFISDYMNEVYPVQFAKKDLSKEQVEKILISALKFVKK
ncbi:MAG: hypothetical protein WCJ58_05855 [bacterium]